MAAYFIVRSSELRGNRDHESLTLKPRVTYSSFPSFVLSSQEIVRRRSESKNQINKLNKKKNRIKKSRTKKKEN